MHRCLGCMEQYKDEYDICPFCGYEKDTPPLEPYHMVPGTLLNERYKVGKVVGFGGFGVTYIGYDTLLDRKVAIKEYLPGEFSTRIPGTTEIVTYEGERTTQFQIGLQKFVDEAKMLAKVQASNGIVQIYDSFQENSTAYIVMEYMEGIELSKYLENKGKLTVEEAKEILHPILLALKDVHNLGIVHRDIAPNNIFLLKDGRVKLYDFGASRFVSSSHSKSLSVIIKPGYAPAEQYSSRGFQGTWTDVYSLAATFYTMITGVVPEDAMDRIEKEELKKPSKLGCKISKSVENALMNALNIKPEDRTQTVEILEKELYRDSKVKLHFVQLRKADVGKCPLWVKLALTTAIVGVVTFAGLLVTGVVDYSYVVPDSFELPEGMTRVPNLVNSDIVTAEALMQDAKLTIQIVDKQHSEFIPEGKVLSQNVKKGKIVHDSDVVEVVISAGREVLYMCDVLGMSRDQAIDVLFQMGVTVEIQEEYSSYAAGAVMSQNVEANTPIYRGDKIILTVSKGVDSYLDENQELELPDFVGMTIDDALETAGKYGIYLQNVATKVKKGKGGIIAEQAPNAGMKVKQGTTINLVLYAEPSVVRMIDVQFKDIDTSVKALENLGFKVEVSYEESTLVASGKIISQSIEKDKEVEQGTTVTLVASKGQTVINDTTTVVYQWSDWMSELPGGVDKSQYIIESKEQYKFRDRSTMTSSRDSEPGWELYDTTVTKGEYGPWSEWAPTQPTAKPDREIDAPKVEYKYSHRESAPNTQTDNNNMPGWLVDDSLTKITYDSWSPWSELSENPVTSSDPETKQVETETWKKYKTKSYKTVTAYENATVPSAPSGYPDYESVRKELDSGKSQVSEWTEIQPSSSDTQAGKTEVTGHEVRSREVTDYSNFVYYYYRWIIYDSSVPQGAVISYDKAECEAYYRNNYGKQGTAIRQVYDQYPTTKKLEMTAEWSFNGHIITQCGAWFIEDAKYTTKIENYDVWQTTYTPYKYTFTFSNTSDWSAPVQTLPSSYCDQTDVKMYKYRTRNRHYVYSFYRWVDDATYGAKQIESSTCKLIDTRKLYRYRDKQDVYTYHYYRWGAWSSDWRDEKMESSENREVLTRTVYRYKPK